jgi:hypothetical protein
VISRYLVIALAFIAGAMRISQGAWTEATGLFALGVGLAILRFARRSLRPAAYVAFAVTALSIVLVLLRR